MNPTERGAAPSSPTPGVTLAAALRSAAGDLLQQQPPPELKARVLAAAQAAAAAPLAGARQASASAWGQHTLAASPRTLNGPGPRPQRSGWWAWSGAAACAAVLAGSALLMLRVPAPERVDDGVRFGGLGGGFLPLVPPERWPRDAAPAWLVSTELPEERLAALGLPYDPAHAGDSVRAELLLHPSGEVLAVRFLH